MSTVDDLARAHELIRELVEHLEYCNWGDEWEREGSETLRQQAYAYLEGLATQVTEGTRPVTLIDTAHRAFLLGYEQGCTARDYLCGEERWSLCKSTFGQEEDRPSVPEAVAPLIAALRHLDCNDNSCEFASAKGGMRTNGGCRCLPVKTAVRIELIKLWRRFR